MACSAPRPAVDRCGRPNCRTAVAVRPARARLSREWPQRAQHLKARRMTLANSATQRGTSNSGHDKDRWALASAIRAFTKALSREQQPVRAARASPRCSKRRAAQHRRAAPLATSTDPRDSRVDRICKAGSIAARRRAHRRGATLGRRACNIAQTDDDCRGGPRRTPAPAPRPSCPRLGRRPVRAADGLSAK
eukprot:363781-Chlamydomonas_euryale.AAC.20